MSKELNYLSRVVARGNMSRRDFLGRAAALGVTSVFANSLLSSAALAEGPVKGGLLKAGMQGGASTDSLDPASWQSQVPYKFGRQWGEQLVAIRPDGSLGPKLATEWDSSPDAKVWTFKIRKDVQFHNGKTLTPEDVVATMERHSDEDSKSGALGLMRGITNVKADGDTVVFTLADPNADLPFLMDDYHLMIQPNGGKDNPAEGIGTGPYRIVTNEPGVRHVGEKFANYWDSENLGHADQIEILVINDATARTSALQSGQVHMINRVDPKIVDLVKRAPGVVIQNVAGSGHYIFVMHCNTAPFDNNDLRLALKYALDREEMVDKVLRGYGSVGNDFPINKSYPLFSEDIEQRTYDPDKAAYHFKKSGHEGPVLLRTSDVAFPGAIETAQLYQESAKKAGINLEVRREPGDGYWSEVWNKQPFSASYWAGRPTQDQMYSTAYLSDADWNDMRFYNDQFDQLLMAARGELDEGKRKQMYRDMGVIVRDEGGAVIPMFNDFIDATNDKVGGWVADGNQEMSGLYALSRCWLKA